MGYGAAARSLIHTKLNRPRVAAQLVDRPRLDVLLDAGRTLTIVTAPAGYGKTTLISDWVQRCGMRYAWVSLDASDNDPAVFLSYLIAALGTLFPSILQEFAARSRLNVAVASSAMAHKLADTLDKIDDVKMPVLIAHGTADDIVPFAMGEKLYAAAKEPKRFLRAEGGSHHNMTSSFFDAYQMAVKDFFQLQQPARVSTNPSAGAAAN